MSEADAGYVVKHEQVAVAGVADLQIRSLLDRQQFSDPTGAADRLGISSALWPLFGLLWPSGRHLARCLGARPVTGGERDDDGALAGFIGRHSSPRAAVWIVDPDGGNRSAFARHMRHTGFVPDGQKRLDTTARANLPAYRERLLAFRRG